VTAEDFANFGIAVLRIHGDDGPPFAEFAFVVLGFIVRDSASAPLCVLIEPLPSLRPPCQTAEPVRFMVDAF